MVVCIDHLFKLYGSHTNWSWTLCQHIVLPADVYGHLSLWVVEEHHPSSGMCPLSVRDEAIVTKWCGYFRSTSQDSLQGKFEKDYWAVEHNVCIKQWTGWGQLVLDALISNSDTTYDDAYTQWYRKITRRFIMREFAY